MAAPARINEIRAYAEARIKQELRLADTASTTDAWTEYCRAAQFYRDVLALVEAFEAARDELVQRARMKATPSHRPDEYRDRRQAWTEARDRLDDALASFGEPAA